MIASKLHTVENIWVRWNFHIWIPNYSNGDYGSDGCFDLEHTDRFIKRENCQQIWFYSSIAIQNCWSLSHGNSAPENVFSINKFIIGLHGDSIQVHSIEALRMVKDAILIHGSIFGVPIT